MTGIATMNWRAALLRDCVSPPWLVYGSFRLSAAWPARRSHAKGQKKDHVPVQPKRRGGEWCDTDRSPLLGYRTCKRSCSRIKPSRSQAGSWSIKTVQIDPQNRVSARTLDLNTNYAIQQSCTVQVRRATCGTPISWDYIISKKILLYTTSFHIFLVAAGKKRP